MEIKEDKNAITRSGDAVINNTDNSPTADDRSVTDEREVIKMKDEETNNHTLSSLLKDEIWKTTDYHDHNILIYPDLSTFREIYAECTKHALDNNEIVFLAPTYDAFPRVRQELLDRGISVDNEAKAGNLFIVDSIKAYMIDTHGAMKFLRTLAVRAARDGKAGIFNISDMGSFFVTERIVTLVEYEETLPKKFDIKSKSICSYHKDDFANLSTDQQERIFSAHNRKMHTGNYIY